MAHVTSNPSAPELPISTPDYLVVIGASAGGLHALRPIVQALGRNGRTAYVLAQHMAPDQASHLTELLGAHSVLTVQTAESGQRLQADHFYICPPHRHVQVIDGQLMLSVPPPGTLISPSVDLLFESAATSHGNQAIGVILSGSGQDGLAGAATLSAAGGLLLVQSLQEAAQPSMPEAVLASQCPALCGTASQLADWLNHPEALHELLAEQFHDSNTGSFTELLGLVSRHIGIDLRQYKENTLRRQTVKRYRSLGFTSLADYLAHVKEHPDEIAPLHQSFMISVSSFFRDPATFDLLEKMLRPVVANKPPGAPIRVWIPACATGEEAYSIALLLSELLGERRSQFDVRVFATDIDQRALEFARTGVYSAEQIASLGLVRRDRWFDREGASWRVSKSLRELCVFSAHDAISNPPFINLDLISCRNLLIYLKPEQQDLLLNTFHYALGPEGLLLLGKSESAGFKSRLFETIDSNHKIYRRRTANTAAYTRTTHVGMPVNLVRSSMQKSGPATPKTRSMLDMARAMLVSEYGPPGVLANTGFEPLHFFGQSHRYFVLPQDSVDFSVFALCRPELRNELKALGYRMLQEPHSVLHGIGTPVQTDAGPMLVRPVLRRVGSAADGSEQNFLISFEETSQQPASTAEVGGDVHASHAASLSDAEIASLRQELADTREHLQAVIEELEASNEELQSLNEEVQSSSEELQSSNEELQSSNEELTTLNDELRLKSIEAAQLNTTLGNIQNSIRTALVVVDLDGKITRYNTLAVRIFGLVPNDIGQHLYGIPCHLNLPQLREQVGSVVASGNSLVERVHQRDFHYLMQIDPYRNELGLCTGVVLTFTDMSELNRAEAARQASEARFRHVWEAGTEGMLVADASGGIVLVNPALEHMFGYAAGELVGQSVDVLVPPELRASHRLQMRTFIDGGRGQTRLMGNRWQINGWRRDGTELTLQISLTTMLLDNSRHVLATMTDVTERQRAAAALVSSEQRLRLALDASQSGTWEWLLDSNQNIWSEQLWALYGLERDRDPPSYESWLGAIHPDDRTRVSEAVGRAAAQGVEFEIEWRVNLPATVPPRWLIARGRPIRGGDGRPYKYIGIVMDITSRHEAEQRRQRSEVLEHELTVLQQVLQSSLAGYFDWNIPAGTEYFSPTFKAMFGYEDDELTNSPETWQQLIFPEDLPGVRAVYQRHVDSRGAQPYYNEVRYRHKDGSTVWVICAGQVIEWGPAGEPLRLVGCHVNITRLRELEAERARNHDIRLSTILENLGTGVYIKDRDYRYIYANRVVCDALQLRLDELIGHTDADILDAESLAIVRAHDRRTLEHGEHLEFEEIIPNLRGEERTYLSIKLPLRRSDGSIDGLCGIATDITERKASEARLKLAASVFTHAQEGILITDPDNRIIEVNDTFCALTGFERARVLGQEVQTLIAEPERTELLPLVCEELTYKGQWHGEASIQRADGSVFPVMLNSSVVQGNAALPQCYVTLFSDISTIKEHQRQLEHVAHYDPLTGLANRVLLADRLQHAMVQAKRRNRHLALVYLDLDGFKAVNDTHGHDVGDRLLIMVSHLLRAALRQGDTLARLGGDEFVAVLSDLASPAEYELVVTRLLQAAATPVRIEQQSFQLSASLGVTLFPLDSGDADTLLRHADQAMYQAKLAGKNRYHLFDPEHDRRTRNRWDSLQHIAQALAAHEFVLHYQPKVNMRSGALVGVEALVRWQHPERGLLAPCEFLPLIEDQPLIAELGGWVLDAALDQALAWRQAGLTLQVSVNIAPLHLQQGDFVERLQAKLASRPDLPPAHLELEVLETAALHNITTLSQTLSQVRQLGVQIALDDFGTGYSSLTYLKRLPASVLKIDQSFVRDMLLDAEDLAIVDGVICLATTFHRGVVAEGVESVEHGELLLRLGCELAQGYGIARPMPAEALPGWAGQWQPAAAWTDRRNRPLTRDELPAIYAEVSLRQWLRWLENRQNGLIEAPPPLDERPCRFGSWFRSAGKQRFGHLAEFITIGETRDQVHKLADTLVRQRTETTPLSAAEQTELDQLCALLLARLRALSAAMWRTPEGS